MSFKYVPRNDFVVLRIVDKGVSIRGVALPEISKEGKDNIVVALGPKVESLHIGDSVLIIGTFGQDVIRLPQEKDLIVTKEANIIAIVKKGEAE